MLGAAVRSPSVVGPGSSVQAGLTTDEARRRLAHFGPNVVTRAPIPSTLERAARQLREPLTLVLLIAAAVCILVLDHPGEAVAIMAIVVINVGIGTSQEQRAANAVEMLAGMIAPVTRVRRSGATIELAASDLVPGDVVDLVAGDRVPADLDLLVTERFAVDETVLTGEGEPAEKDSHRQATANAVLGDRVAEAFAGTLVVRGTAVGCVRETGDRSVLGSMARELAMADDPPLVVELRSVASRLSLAALVLGAALVPVAIWRGDGSRRAALEAVLAGLALAIAAVPEGLGTVVTSALALGARRLAKRGAIVRRLPAIETLGAATVLCTDKTGTITTGHLSIAEVCAAAGRERDLLVAAQRCNDSQDGVGDPVDVALADLAADASISDPLGDRVAVDPFDATTRSMSTVHVVGNRSWVTVKGAPEVVFRRCRRDIVDDHVRRRLDRMAADGLRVIALAQGESADLGESHLTFLGAVGLHDPIRSSARAALDDCRRAGVRVVMVTGDHDATACSVGEAVGLDTSHALTGDELAGLPAEERAARLRSASIVARVDPSVKVELVDAYRAIGDVVAMTGDGVNDARAHQDSRTFEFGELADIVTRCRRVAVTTATLRIEQSASYGRRSRTTPVVCRVSRLPRVVGL